MNPAELHAVASRLHALSELTATRFTAAADLAAERDRRYEARFTAADAAVATALIAQKEAVAAAFVSSKEAIIKAEAAQAAYNNRSNEFRASLDDANKSNIPRPEADSRFRALEEKIEELKKQLNVVQIGAGATAGKSEGASATWAAILAGGAFAVALLTAAVNVWVATHK